ncbi:MAG: hypothetical protein K0R03_2327 [Moraxellaceae bacterium]|jgi:hypothetical protein|nr:hypothetical protein [Moraxellaceae bacterium]
MAEFFREFWRYARQRKKFWLLPLVLVLLLISLLIASVQVVATSPFLYTLF